MKLFQSTCRRVGVMMCVPLSEDPPLKIWEGEKNVQNSARFPTTFDCDRDYLRNGSSRRKSDKNRYQLQPLPRWAKKLGELWSANNRVIVDHIDQPSGHLSGDYISAIRECCPLKFLSALEIDQGYLAQTQLGQGSHPKKNNREN